MKKYLIYTLIFFFLGISCKAQNPIVSIDTYRHDVSNNSYLKDVNNEFDKFEGTWLYTNGTTSLKIILQKEEMSYNGNYYEDYIVGEYQYIENGVEKINTLGNFGLNALGTERAIGGNYIIANNERPICNSCNNGERRIDLYIIDPQRKYLNYAIVLRYMIGQTNPEKMTVTIFAEDGAMLPTANSPETLRVPDGEYVMEKQ